jgi:hypothetical protein
MFKEKVYNILTAHLNIMMLLCHKKEPKDGRKSIDGQLEDQV